MAVPITVPRLDWSMDEGTFVEWLKGEGEPVKPGEALFVLESDKATVNIEAIDAGLLRLVLESPKPHDKVKVGQVLAYLVAEGEGPVVARSPDRATLVVARSPDRATGATEGLPGAASVLARSGDRATTRGSGDRATTRGSGDRATTSVARSGDRATTRASRAAVAISPRARRVARELGIDCSGLHGSGRNGRIRERDVRAAPTGAAGKIIPHTSIRRIIAARVLAGVTEAAPVTLTTKADATNLVQLRAQFKLASGLAEAVPGYTDLIVTLTAKALDQHPLLQAQWREDGLFVPDRIDLAVGVDTEAGLLAPVLRNVGRMTLHEVTGQLRELIAQARAGQLTAEQSRDATFTITNLGMFGVDAFTPIIQLPQCAILGVGRIVREPAVIEDRIVPRDQLTLSLTFDHRVVDGAPAARFLDTVRRCIEQPAPWFIP